MQKFSFEFKTTKGAGASSHHYSISGNTEADARDNLVAELGEIIVSAKALKVSATPPPAAAQEGEAAPTGDAAPADAAAATVAARKAKAAARAKASRAAKKSATPKAPKAKGGK